MAQLILFQTYISFAQSKPEWTPVKKLNAGSFYWGWNEGNRAEVRRIGGGVDAYIADINATTTK